MMANLTAEHRESLAETWAGIVRSADLVSALERAGVQPILIKGAALHARLYSPDEPRISLDVDVLVGPHQQAEAERILRAQGFRAEFMRGDDPTGLANHASSWRRASDGVIVDLHATLPEAKADAASSWLLLESHGTVRQIAGKWVTVLDDPGTALLAALHAAHHGSRSRLAAEDLRRAASQIDEAAWAVAAELARQIGAFRSFSEGLALIRETSALCDLLAVRTEISVRHHLLEVDAPWGAIVLDHWARSGAGSRLRLCWRLIAPHPRALRSRSSIARRGYMGLLTAYLLRPAVLVSRIPGAARALRAARARQTTGPTSEPEPS
jgi:hypothetical protein